MWHQLRNLATDLNESYQAYSLLRKIAMLMLCEYFCLLIHNGYAIELFTQSETNRVRFPQVVCKMEINWHNFYHELALWIIVQVIILFQHCVDRGLIAGFCVLCKGIDQGGADTVVIGLWPPAASRSPVTKSRPRWNDATHLPQRRRNKHRRVINLYVDVDDKIFLLVGRAFFLEPFASPVSTLADTTVQIQT